jgi:hypothetical protein
MAEQFYTKEDLDFIDQIKNLRNYATRKHILLTDKGIYKKTPFKEIRQHITHIKLLKHRKMSNYPSLKYLDYTIGVPSDMNFNKFPNLKVLALYFTYANDKILLNLPTLDTLVFDGLYWSELYNHFRDEKFTFENLPSTLKNIFFKSAKIEYDKSKNKKIINLIKEKTIACKIPLNCQIYFISHENEIFNITLDS